MSKMLAALGAALAVVGASLFSLGASDHAHTITITKQGSGYDAAKDPVFEIDWAHTTTFTIVNDTDDNLYFAIDAAPRPQDKCRVTFEPPVADCISQPLAIGARGRGTLLAHAADMGTFEYSWFFGRPRFKSDALVGPSLADLRKVDPDLELERDIGTAFEMSVMVTAIVALLAAWLTRRRS